MRLARLVYRNNSPWWVRADMEVNPPIGTIVQYECALMTGTLYTSPGYMGALLGRVLCLVRISRT